jgi:hypothetical protein
LNRLSQKRTVAPQRPILAAISGAPRPSRTACRAIRARRTSPAPSVCERAIRASSSAPPLPSARTRTVMTALPESRAGLNVPASQELQSTYRMHH